MKTLFIKIRMKVTDKPDAQQKLAAIKETAVQQGPNVEVTADIRAEREKLN